MKLITYKLIKGVENIMVETIWICVYRDTIEEHNNNDNLTEVKVTMDFFKQYFNERKKNIMTAWKIF